MLEAVFVKRDVLRRVLLYWVPLIGWMAAIFALSGASPATIESTSSALPEPVTKPPVVHPAEFAGLAILAYRLFLSHGVRAPLTLWAGVLSLAVAYGALDELHQAFVPGRDASFLDVGYDALGGMLGLLMADAATRLGRLIKRTYIGSFLDGLRVHRARLRPHRRRPPEETGR